MEKETIEKAAEKYVKNFAPSVKSAREIGFIAGANWQAERNELRLKHKQALLDNCEKCLDMRIKQTERMYSEEDMIEFAKWVFLEVGSNTGKDRTNKELFNEWFEQFKNK